MIKILSSLSIILIISYILKKDHYSTIKCKAFTEQINPQDTSLTSKYKINTIYFYGNVYTQFTNKWHNIESPYFGQSLTRKFPAIINIQVYENDEKTLVSDVCTNISFLGEGPPLIVEFVDNLKDTNETFIIHINLVLPDKSTILLEKLVLNNEVWSENKFGGEDGVFKFLVTNENYDYNDYDSYDTVYTLLWLPLPDIIRFAAIYPNSTSYFLLDNVTTNPKIEKFDYNIGNGWGGNGALINGHIYIANIFPYYNIPNYNIYKNIKIEQWNKINWIINNYIGISSVDEIQNAIWFMLGYSVKPNIIALKAKDHGNYIIPKNGYIIIIIDPLYDITLKERVIDKPQLATIKLF
jgi:hypothetical protein